MLILYYFHVETLFRAFEIYLSDAIPIQRKMSINIPSLFFKFTFSRVVSPYVFRTRLRAVGFVRLRRGQQITNWTSTSSCRLRHVRSCVLSEVISIAWAVSPCWRMRSSYRAKTFWSFLIWYCDLTIASFIQRTLVSKISSLCLYLCYWLASLINRYYLLRVCSNMLSKILCSYNWMLGYIPRSFILWWISTKAGIQTTRYSEPTDDR